MAAALAVGVWLHHPGLTIPLAVGSLYASANDRPHPTPRRLRHILLPALGGAIGLLAGAATRDATPVPVVLLPALVAGVAGAISTVGPSASAAGLQLLTMTALGQGLPAHGPRWLPAPLLICGALPVLLLTGSSAVCRALAARGRRTAPPDPAVRHTAVLSRHPARDALRLAACAGVAEVVALLLHPVRGYWLLLTVALVVKPDLAPVPRRSVQRGLGTLAGVTVAAALFAPRPGTAWLCVVLVVAATLVPVATARGYAALTAVVAPMVFILLRLGGAASDALLGWRLLDTALGIAIALSIGHPWRRAQRESSAFIVG
ncbi:MAG TPA: FUSC family protein [Oryzihumus sp.]|nr:FUSC family protein [Oryzihumus sp.]